MLHALNRLTMQRERPAKLQVLWGDGAMAATLVNSSEVAAGIGFVV